ncbi:MAG: AmmeMemoRadiSam system radical SAM enzyme [Thermodesulfobacteriaceae bacterium]|nr:AmmeMemoRadiSam system radical SAM enzyme [Thermodesulfobacteriaceae bacterium]
MAIKEALLQESLGKEAKCLTCERKCVIPEGAIGFCKTRKNIGGKIYTLVYGEISSLSANPIEKKPLYHFFPGSKALTVGTWGCNFTCPWCQNYEISKFPERIGKGLYLSPEKFIELVKKYHCQGTSISFNEPTLLLEYAIEVFKLAKSHGYYNTYVTNGYMTEEALVLLIEAGLGAANIDIKGDKETVTRYCGADVEKVWRKAKIAKEKGVWIEITTLLIPGINDDEKTLRSIAQRIKNELGKETPWHVNRYFPAYQFEWDFYVPPTPIETLERARSIGKEEGLEYVYCGNVPGHPFENTYCPKCNFLLIKRYALNLLEYNLVNKRCPNCKKEIPIIN